MQRGRLCLLTIVFALVASACGASAEGRPLVVLAASSLTDVLPPIAESYELSTGVPVELSFAGSSTLREQILEGAPADVFIAANPEILVELVQVGIVQRSIEPIATTSIVLAVPTGNPAGITGLESLEVAATVVGLCAAEVPCGQVGADVLVDAGIDADVDTFEPNVRALLGKLELGEVDAGLVYATDAVDNDLVETVGAPFVGTGTTTFVAAGLLGSGSDADRFVDFLTGGLAQEALLDAGFEAP